MARSCVPVDVHDVCVCLNQRVYVRVLVCVKVYGKSSLSSQSVLRQPIFFSPFFYCKWFPLSVICDFCLRFPFHFLSRVTITKRKTKKGRGKKQKDLVFFPHHKFIVYLVRTWIPKPRQQETLSSWENFILIRFISVCRE